jgi:hypothetical protein
MLIQSAPKIGPTHEGWIIAVTVPRIGTRNPLLLFFAVGHPDANHAENAVRAHMGGLHCKLETRLSVSSRALSQLGVRSGEVKPLGDGRHT